jgi:hypothetical protein
MDPITIAAAGGMGMLGGFLNWMQSKEALDYQKELNDWNRQRAIDYENIMRQEFYDPVRDYSIEALNQMWPMISYGNVELGDALRGFHGGMPALFGMFRDNVPPEMRGEQNYLRMLGASADPVRDTAAQLFAGGGWTPARQDYNDRLYDMFGGRDASIGTLGDVGRNLVSQRGQTNLTRSFGDRAIDTLNAGGMNPYLDAGMATALGITGAQGRSDLTSAGLPFAMSLLGGAAQSGGQTPYTAALTNRGLDLAGREALLPTEMAMAAAGDQTASAFDKQREAVLARAMARGGGPGAITAAGGQTRADAEFEDERREAIANAQRQALLGQQSLGLQQMGIGGNMAGQGVDAARAQMATMLGTGSNLLTGLGGLENQRLMSALDSINQLNNAATSRIGTVGQLGLGGGQLETARMQSGAGMLGQDIDSRQRALQMLESGTTNQQRIALEGGDLYNRLLGTQGDFSNMLMNSMLENRAQNMADWNQYFNAENTMFGNRQANLNQMANIFGSFGINPMLSMGGQYGNMFANVYGHTGTSNPLGAYSVQSPWVSGFESAGKAVKGILEAGKSGK